VRRWRFWIPSLPLYTAFSPPPTAPNMSGVVVTPHPTLARTLTATRAFQPGELILAEEPILTWENPVGSEGFVNFIIAFNKLNPGSKDVVRDMHCPADRASLREFAVEVCGRVEGEGVEEVLVLLGECPSASSFFAKSMFGPEVCVCCHLRATCY